MALDYETDAAIQRFLRNELGKDTTVITIAHRLQTVMDSDKIVSLRLALAGMYHFIHPFTDGPGCGSSDGV
jgi:ABC-type transport system involved in cytochrome bd biosynthesis fused ATPase/permease subunit